MADNGEIGEGDGGFKEMADKAMKEMVRSSFLAIIL